MNKNTEYVGSFPSSYRFPSEQAFVSNLFNSFHTWKNSRLGLHTLQPGNQCVHGNIALSPQSGKMCENNH